MKPRSIWPLLGLVLSLIFGPNAKAQDSDQVIFSKYKPIAQAILKRFPPDQYMYLGLGRSPTVVMAILEEVHPGSTQNVPLSMPGGGFSNVPQDELFRHFDQFIPSKQRVGNRKPVLIDFVQGGSSYQESYSLILRYLQITRPNFKQLSRFTFGHNAVSDRIRSMVEGHGGKFGSYELRHEGSNYVGSLLQEFSSERFKAHSEFPTYIPGRTPPPMARSRSEYLALRQRMKAQISSDPDFSQPALDMPGTCIKQELRELLHK